MRLAHVNMTNLINTLREKIGPEDLLYFGGITLLYIGSAAQFGHPIAQIITGGVLIVTALLITFKGA